MTDVWTVGHKKEINRPFIIIKVGVFTGILYLEFDPRDSLLPLVLWPLAGPRQDTTSLAYPLRM